MAAWSAFLFRFFRRSLRGASFAFTLGFWLFVLNWPFGYGGAAVCGLLALRGSPRFWGAAAVAVYALSWVMLGLGTLLLGANAKTLARDWRRSSALFRRIRAARNLRKKAQP